MSRIMTDDVRTAAETPPATGAGTSPDTRPDPRAGARPGTGADTAADAGTSLAHVAGADPAAVIPAAPEHPDHRPVLVRRHGSLSAVIGLGASALSALYLVRAVDQGGAASWAVGLVLGVLALFHLTQWVDSRTPLLVADDTGVRLRLGNVWHGLLWEDVDRVSVRPRQGRFKDGRIVVHPVDDTALVGLTRRSRRRLAANTRLYGAPFAMPLGLTTVSSTDDLAGSLEALAAAGPRVDVVVAEPPAPGPTADEPSAHEPPADEPDAAAPLPGEGPGRAAHGRSEPPAPAWDVEDGADPEADTDPRLSPVAAGPTGTAPPAPDPTREPTPGHEPEPGPEPAPGPEPQPGPEPVPTPEPQRTPEPAPQLAAEGAAGTGVERTGVHNVEPQQEPRGQALDEAPEPLRPVRRARRAEITRTPSVRAPVHGQLALQEPVPEGDSRQPHGAEDQEGPDGADGADERLTARVRGNMSLVLGPPAESTATEPEVDAEAGPEPEPAPAVEPVIGPVITEARELLGLSVDELAARTRIRPHVIEAIEVDDFGPCAGDFYARGHLRALGRVLGIDAQPLVEVYEERYATEPISASRVFEAELAAGDSGAFRGVGTATAPRWGALLVAVVVLAVFWGLAAWFADDAAGSADDAPERPRSSAPLQPGSRAP